MFHHTHNALNCTIIVILCEKASQIWNNFCIFAHGFEVLSLLFSDYKDTHFLWVIQTSEPFLFQNYVKSRLWIFTCETLVQFYTNLGIVIESIKVKENTVFCLMPFNDRYSAIYQAIFYSCQAANYSCTRSDEVYNPGNLLRQIINMLLESSIIIALLDRQNPNVFYE